MPERANPRHEFAGCAMGVAAVLMARDRTFLNPSGSPRAEIRI